jgi:hypothetical protein
MTNDPEKPLRFGVLSPPESQEIGCTVTEEVVRINRPYCSGVSFGENANDSSYQPTTQAEPTDSPHTIGAPTQ